MELDSRPLPPWQVFYCGGVEIYGTANCGYVDSNFICNCPEKLKEKFNFALHYDLLTNIYQHKMHIIEYLYPRQKLEKWEEFVSMLQQSDSIWSRYKRQKGCKYEDKLANSIKLVSKRHGIGAHANGFETHPELTPFEKLVLLIIKDIEREKQKKEFEVLISSF